MKRLSKKGTKWDKRTKTDKTYHGHLGTYWPPSGFFCATGAFWAFLLLIIRAKYKKYKNHKTPNCSFCDFIKYIKHIQHILLDYYYYQTWTFETSLVRASLAR
jgi:hypothetical protein